MPLVVSTLRFWALVEPYCADITNEEIRLLEELLKPPDDEPEYYKVRLTEPTRRSTPHQSVVYTGYHTGSRFVLVFVFCLVLRTRQNTSDKYTAVLNGYLCNRLFIIRRLHK